MANIYSKKTRKTFTVVVAIVLILSMVVPLVASLF